MTTTIHKVARVATAVVVAVAVSACAKKPAKIQKSAHIQGINNAILEERYNFVPQDRILRQSNWAYEVEAQAKNDYFFENSQMVKVFLLAHNADKIIIMGERKLASQYRNYFRVNGVHAYIDVQPIDLKEELQDRVKILFFSSKANFDDTRDVNVFIIEPIKEPDIIEEPSILVIP